jgi:uncharacterized Zn-binding protein involved in type VI secretion
MPGYLFHVGAQAICPHGGQISTASSNARVKIGGQFVATMADTSTIAGCPFSIPSVGPHPCVKVQWLVPALRVKVNNNPVLLQTSPALCLAADQVPQGPPQVTVAQKRVKGI